MSPEQIERKIRNILWGRYYTTIDLEDSSQHFQTRILSAIEQAEADALKDKFIDINIASGMIKEKDIIPELELRGLWDRKNDFVIKEYRKKARRAKEDAASVYKYDKHNKNRMIAQARRLDLAADKLEEIKWNYFCISAEYMADIERMLWIIQRTTYTEDGDGHYWQSFNDIKNEKNRLLIIRLINAYSDNMLDVSSIRQIARSAQWRFRWHSSKNDIRSLFGVGFRDIDSNQDMLVYWSQVYDSAFESMERPSNLIIESDDAFDDWLENQSKKTSSGNKGKINNRPSRGGKPQTGKQIVNEETFIMVHDKGSAKEVQDMNPDRIKQEINQEGKKIIQKGGQVTERNLRFRKGKK